MKKFKEPILVTRPYLPDLEKFKVGLEEIWHSQWLTNNGPMVQWFQKELAAYLGVSETNIALFNNGTLALELGYQAMGLAGGDVITTPFTFVATSHALKRIGATPIFADIDPETLCLDPAKVEKLITSRTKAIVPVHVYGNLCDVEGFNRLSEKYGIPVIYDAAHAFGAKYRPEARDQRPEVVQVQDKSSSSSQEFETRGQRPESRGISSSSRFEARGYSEPRVQSAAKPQCSTKTSQTSETSQTSYTSVAACGDMSMFSFHPTKLFHSCEGGCLVFKNAALQEKLFSLRNFAIKSETVCDDVGSNAKMNELQALMGIQCLKKINDLIAYRHRVAAVYEKAFAGTTIKWIGKSANDAYCPVLFENFETREKVYTELKEKCNVFTRRYFFPILTDFAPYIYAKNTCPIAADIASRVLTLPTYYGLPLEDVRVIAEDVLEFV